MELNKTGLGSLQHSSRDPSVETEGGPRDSRDVKPFSLDEGQGSNNQCSEETELHDDILWEQNKESLSTELFSFQEEKRDQHVVHHAAGSMMTPQNNIQQVLPTQVSETATISQTSSADLRWMSDLILSTVETLLVGELQGEQFVEMGLSAHHDVPSAFIGANVSLVQSGQELTVSFSNFQDITQQQEAQHLVLSQQEQLQSLISALQARNLQLKSMSVGQHVVQLPQVEEVRSPLHMIAATMRNQHEEQGQQQDQQRRDQQQDQNQDHWI